MIPWDIWYDIKRRGGREGREKATRNRWNQIEDEQVKNSRGSLASLNCKWCHIEISIGETIGNCRKLGTWVCVWPGPGREENKRRRMGGGEGIASSARVICYHQWQLQNIHTRCKWPSCLCLCCLSLLFFYSKQWPTVHAAHCTATGPV